MYVALPNSHACSGKAWVPSLSLYNATRISRQYCFSPQFFGFEHLNETGHVRLERIQNSRERERERVCVCVCEPTLTEGV